MKTLTKYLIISICTLFLLPYFFINTSSVAYALGGCKFETETEIACTGEKFIRADTERVTKLNNSSASKDRTYFAESIIKMWEAGQTPNYGSSITLHNDNPLIGDYTSANASGGGTSQISIADPLGVAPPARISLGTGLTFNGMVNFETRDGKGIPINTKLLIGDDGKGKELKLRLLDKSQGIYLNFEGDLNGWGEKQVVGDVANKKFWYNQMTVKDEMFADKEYILQSNYPDDKFVDCFTGQDNGNNAMEQCSLKYHGSVTFIITKNKEIHIVDANASAAEKKSEGVKVPISAASKEDGLNLTIKEELDSPLDKALSGMIANLASFVSTGLNFVMKGIDSLLTETEKYVLGVGIEGSWTKIRNVALTLLVFALIIIAFANTLSIDIERYGLNRMIPRIIISIIMAYSSWLIVTFFFDMVNALQGQAIGLMGGANGLELLKNTEITTPTSSDIVGKIGAIIVLLVIFFLVLICGVILFFSLIMRVVMLSFLLAVAPLAFILNIMPFTENIYKSWWKEFWKWMFMAPIALAIIALGSVIANGTGYATASYSDTTITDPDGINILIGLLIFAASLVMASSIPLKWGGNIMAGWQKAGKWGRDNLLAGKYVKQGWNDFQKARGDRSNLRYQSLRAGIANKVPGGRLLTGTNKAQATALKEGIDKSYESMFSKLSATDLQREAGKGGRRGMMAAKVMQDKYGDAIKAYALPGQLNEDGSWNSDNPLVREQWEKDAKKASTGQLAQYMSSDRDFYNHMVKENPEAALRVAAATGNAQILGAINSASAGKSWSQKNKDQVKQTVKDYERIQKETTASGKWGNVHAIATGTDSNEQKIADLHDKHGMSWYDATQIVNARDMHKSMDTLNRSGNYADQRTKAGDKLGPAMDDFNTKVKF